MGACSRRDFEVSIPIITYLLEEGANASHQAPPNSLLGEGTLCSRLELSRDTPIKNAASKPELLRLLVDAGAALDANVVVYAVEDWCDEIAGHLGEMWARELAKSPISEIMLGLHSETMGETTVTHGNAIRPFEFGAGRVVKKVADILNCEGGGDEDGETKGDEAAMIEGANPFTTFTSQIAAALQEVLDMGGNVNAPDTAGT